MADRKVMLVAGEKAHSLYHSENVKSMIPNNAELVVVPGADHCDLYDKTDLIPFAKLENFFKENLA